MKQEPKSFLSVVVPGLPIQQGSKVAILPKNSRRPIVVDDNKETLFPWRQLIVTCIHRSLRSFAPDPELGPVHVVALFAFTPPLRVPAGRLGLPAVYPDLDKLIRSAGDALTMSGVIKDDGQVVRWSAVKQYVGHRRCPLTSPGLWLRIYRCLDDRLDDE